jgi:O-acetylhomoserine (thiol)-lyase
MTDRKFGFDTQQLHAGHVLDGAVRARAVPIYQSTSFVFKDFATAKAINAIDEFGWEYSRTGNPTNEVLEQRIAALEGGTAALALASGMAATTYSVLNIAAAGDEIVASRTLYGGTFSLLAHTLPKHGINTVFANPDRPESFKTAITEKTKAILIETIGNPGANLIDIEKVARIAQEAEIPLLVDNTFATPYLFRPFDYGANVIIHSATKYIGGHGNSIGGLIVDGGNFNWANGKFPSFTTPDPALEGMVHWDRWGNFPGIGNFAFVMKTRLQYLRDMGACLSPFNAFLLLMGLETLSFRVERQVKTAQRIAEFLESHPDVAWVSYPGLKSSPHHDLAQRLLPKGAGAIFSFAVKGGEARAAKLVEAVKVFSFLANVGDSKSLIVHPATITHAQLDADQKREAGITPETLRLSIGTEDPEDLIWDLEQALAASRA